MDVVTFLYIVSLAAFANAIRLARKQYKDRQAERNYAEYRAKQTHKVSAERVGLVRAGEREWGRESV